MAPTTAHPTGQSTPVHLHGPPLDHPMWNASTEDTGTDDGFDAEALERAMTESRRAAYAALADLDAA